MHRLIGGMKTAVILAWALAAMAAMAGVAGGQTGPIRPITDSPQTSTVSRTFNRRPFDYRMRLLAAKPRYRIYRLTYPSPVVTPVEPNNTIPADYYLPEGLGPGDPKRPAVICLHILAGNFELVHMTCSVLASRGIPAIMFKLPYYGERRLPASQRRLAANPRLFVEAMSQAFEDVRRTVDVLASRPEVDAEHIGIMGISLGGIVAATAAGTEPRLARTALILAGGDLRHIIHHARETRGLSELIRGLPPQTRGQLEAKLDSVDPLRHAPRLRDRALRGKVLMINAAEDHVITRPCTEKLAAALGITERVIWLEGLGHYTALAALPQTLKKTTEFFAEDLPPGVPPAAPPAAVDGAQRKVVRLLQQAGAMLVSEPKPGRCHFVDLEGSATLDDGKRVEAKFRFVRGDKHRFSIYCKLPEVGEVALGQGAYPWMAAGDKVVFQGTLDDGAEPAHPLTFSDGKHRLKLQMLSGLLAALAIAPETLETWVTIEDDPAADGTPALRIANRQNAADSLRIVFDREGNTPQRIAFHIRGNSGAVTVRGWQFNTVAHDALFEEPGQLPVKQVAPADLYRIFSAAFNFAMEKIQ